MTTRVSIVIPAYNEARRIATALVSLEPLRAAGHEVIVVDGGSTDATLSLAAPLADRAFTARRGRASQMNAGAAVASHDILLFLHADSRLPDAGTEHLIGEMARTRRRWGRFDVTIAGRRRALDMVAAMMNARSRLTGIATGDQGIFVLRSLFGEVGGYPDQPLMEDIELSKRLKRTGGSPLCLSQRVTTSGRRWEHLGTGRTIVSMWRLRYAYWRSVDAAHLAARYGATPPPPRVTLQIFAKNPIPGQVKTRLAAAIGEREAAAVYARFVETTLTTAVAARAAGVVDSVELWCDVGAPAFAAWRDRFGVTLRVQSGADLGTRMRNALDMAIAVGSRAILIGTDCPALDVTYLSQAVAALDDNDAVFGPAEDGGYVLVGVARSLDAFSGIRWSTPAVMAATREKLVALRATWRELPTLWDVDEPISLARWERRATTAAD